MDSHYFFASTIGGSLLCNPMKSPLNGVAEIVQANNKNVLSWLALAIRVSYSKNYKTIISEKVCQEGEQFPFTYFLLYQAHS